MLLPFDLEESDDCPVEDCDGIVFYDIKGCNCHINPPCSACVDAVLECSSCGETFEEE